MTLAHILTTYLPMLTAALGGLALIPVVLCFAVKTHHGRGDLPAPRGVDRLIQTADKTSTEKTGVQA